MLNYKIMLLELKSIEKKFDKYYLYIHMLFGQHTKNLFIEVDKYTAKNLKSITDFNKNYKYRLSLNSLWDTVEQQYKSTLTWTYREQSKSVYFLCSKDYINKINTIKSIQNISNLSTLSFVCFNLLEDNIKKEDNRQRYSLVKAFKKYIRKPIEKPTITVSFIFVILFIYLGHIFLNETILSKKVLAQPIDLYNEIDMEQNKLPVQLNQHNNILVEDTFSSEPNIPFVKLDYGITYTLPEGNVALTFDDGPSKYTLEILDILNKYEVGGTFFFIGYNAKIYPNYIKKVQSNGYSIGSHSMNHIKLSNLSYEKQRYELLQSMQLLEEIIDEEVIFFRPAYGSYTKKMKNLINKHQYKMVLWDIDPRDWETRNADKVFDYIKSSDVSGSIILLHESKAVVEALPRIIEYLKSLDLQIVNLK